jgi:predicted nuclease of restriction endonuclease-like (RecB) superfamily
MKKEFTKTGYGPLLAAIKERIREAQYLALRAVNRELVSLYRDIGRLIVERQKGETWGKSVVQKLSADLRKEFPDVAGYSADNLWRMRKLHLLLKTHSKLAPLVQEISWAKIVVIMESCKDNLEREFYIRMARRSGWSKNVLIHQIEAGTYEKTLSNQTNFNKTLPRRMRERARIEVRDEYLFDFLDIREKHSERQLEKAVLSKMDRFLREMGGALTFVGSQYRLEVGGKEYFIDILLYHRHLRCLLAIELKVGEFVPEYIGKMQFYLAVLDDTVKAEGENPAIGIIVCKSKEKMTVEYALRESQKPIGVATYRITSRLPHDLKKELPGPEQIGYLLEKI